MADHGFRGEPNLTFVAVPDDAEKPPPQIYSPPDRLWAAATGTLVLMVYLRTLAPGMIPIMDTPMFQFMGRVLGVGHNPGYPTSPPIQGDDVPRRL